MIVNLRPIKLLSISIKLQFFSFNRPDSTLSEAKDQVQKARANKSTIQKKQGPLKTIPIFRDEKGTEKIYIHTVNNDISLAPKGSDILSKFMGVTSLDENAIRVLIPSEQIGWRNTRPGSETDVYRSILQNIRNSCLVPYESKYQVFGKILPYYEDRFLIANQLREKVKGNAAKKKRGGVCKDFGKEQILEVMWYLKIPRTAAEMAPAARVDKASKVTELGKILGLSISEISQWSNYQIDYYYVALSGGGKANTKPALCALIKQFMEQNKMIYRGDCADRPTI